MILASASPRRRELLAQLGVAFEIVVAEVTEHEEASTDPRVMVAHNAALKADWVAARHPGLSIGPIVAAQSYRHPPLFAKMLASLDALMASAAAAGDGGGDNRQHRREDAHGSGSALTRQKPCVEPDHAYPRN